MQIIFQTVIFSRFPECRKIERSTLHPYNISFFPLEKQSFAIDDYMQETLIKFQIQEHANARK